MHPSKVLVFSVTLCGLLTGCATTQTRSTDREVKAIAPAAIDAGLTEANFVGLPQRGEPDYGNRLYSQPNPQAPNGWLIAQVPSPYDHRHPYGDGAVTGTVAALNTATRSLSSVPTSMWIPKLRTLNDSTNYYPNSDPPGELIGYNQTASSSPDGRWLLLEGKPNVTRYHSPIDIPTVTVKADLSGEMWLGLWDRKTKTLMPTICVLSGSERTNRLWHIWSPDSNWVVLSDSKVWIVNLQDFQAK